MVPRIFDRYLGKQVLSATLLGVLLLSGVMVLGNVYKQLDQLLGGAELPIGVVLEFVALIIPFSLIFTIPWAFLTGILLVFGRMSADNELLSLRMTGWSMGRICASVFVMAVAFSGICYWVNVSLAPTAKDRMKRMFYEVALENPAALFQEGRVLDKIPEYRIYTGARNGNELTDVKIIKMQGTLAKQTIRAKRAILDLKPGVLDFQMRLFDATFEDVTYTTDKKMDKVAFATAAETAYVLPLSNLEKNTVRVNASMKATTTLWDEVSSSVDSVTHKPMDAKARSLSMTELSKRYSFSLACFTFALVGIPLGVTAHRRETSSGFALSLITATAYFVFTILADTLN
ncbi:MAG: LptF/LptG family permease, partial [Prosthecobacter sp.]|nr:LptF/LptG family permease [Prosthecobacter sp.]